jgi:hypothetical protein
MDQNENIAYLLNSTPKYYYILELHVVLLERYIKHPWYKWKIFLATEEPLHPMCILLKEKYGVELLMLEKENSSFLASRKRALELLPSQYTYVLPMQEDFLLERSIDTKSMEESIEILEKEDTVFCVRYMPCPGPHKDNLNYCILLYLVK